MRTLRAQFLESTNLLLILRFDAGHLPLNLFLRFSSRTDNWKGSFFPDLCCGFYVLPSQTQLGSARLCESPQREFFPGRSSQKRCGYYSGLLQRGARTRSYSHNDYSKTRGPGKDEDGNQNVVERLQDFLRIFQGSRKRSFSNHRERNGRLARGVKISRACSFSSPLLKNRQFF